jgi:hypothetical protein
VRAGDTSAADVVIELARSCCDRSDARGIADWVYIGLCLEKPVA